MSEYIALKIVRPQAPQYLYAQLLAGLTYLVATCFLLWLRFRIKGFPKIFTRRREKTRKKRQIESMEANNGD